MKENKLTLLNKDGKKKIFSVLFEVVGDDFNYVVYSANKYDANNELIVYFGKYATGDDNFKNVNKKEEESLLLILSKFRGKNEEV